MGINGVGVDLTWLPFQGGAIIQLPLCQKLSTKGEGAEEKRGKGVGAVLRYNQVNPAKSGLTLIPDPDSTIGPHF